MPDPAAAVAEFLNPAAGDEEQLHRGGADAWPPCRYCRRGARSRGYLRLRRRRPIRKLDSSWCRARSTSNEFCGSWMVPQGDGRGRARTRGSRSLHRTSRASKPPPHPFCRRRTRRWQPHRLTSTACSSAFVMMRRLAARSTWGNRKPRARERSSTRATRRALYRRLRLPVRSPRAAFRAGTLGARILPATGSKAAGDRMARAGRLDARAGARRCARAAVPSWPICWRRRGSQRVPWRSTSSCKRRRAITAM